MPWGEAIEYEPSRPTYGIRIASFNHRGDFRKYPLRHYRSFKQVFEYVFDDINPNSKPLRDEILFDNGLAEKIINDFDENREGCEVLLVHCMAGKNRSPSVAIALNELFDLGHNTFELKERYPEFNRYVYEEMRKAGRNY